MLVPGRLLVRNGLRVSLTLSSIRPTTTTTTVGLRCCVGGAHYDCFSTKASKPLSMPMIPGTPITGLDIYKDKEAPVALKRSEYPEWVGKLAEPLISLAKLRKMSVEEATMEQQQRYLKLVRRLKIKENNEEAKDE